MPNIYFEELFEELGAPKPTPAIQNLPKWFRDMPRFYGSYGKDSPHVRDWGTVRDCPAVSDLMTAGYMLHLPCDVFIDATGDEIVFDSGTFGNASRIKDAGFEFMYLHEIEATKGYQSAFDFHPQSLKWQTYWGITTDEGYSTLFCHPFHRTDLPFYMASAIVDTDKFGTRNPYAFFIKKGFKGTIQRGTPMLQVIPFKREEWEMQIVKPDSLKYHIQSQQVASVFTQPYKRLFWQRKKYS